MTTKLQFYNKALQLIGQRSLAALSENNRSRRELDLVWDSGAVQEVLEEGNWNYATRTVKLRASTSIEPEFGYQYAFLKPSDWVKTTSICYDEYFDSPISNYHDEVKYWFCTVDEIYVRYVSNDVSYGNNFADMPMAVQRYLELLLAVHISKSITQDNGLTETLKRDLQRAKLNAFSQDGANQPAGKKPVGAWASARLNGVMSLHNSTYRH